MKLNVKAPLHQNLKQQSQFPSFRLSSSRNEEQKKDPFQFSSDPNRNYVQYQLGAQERNQARSGQGRYDQYSVNKQSPSNQVHSVSQSHEAQQDPFSYRQKQMQNNKYKEPIYEDNSQVHNQRSISTSIGRADNYYSQRFTPESQTLQRQSQFFDNNNTINQNNYMSTGDNFHSKLEDQFKDAINQNLQFGYHQRQSEPKLSSSRPKQYQQQAFSSLLSTQNNMIQSVCDQIKFDQAQILDAFEGELIDFINSNYNSFTENDIVGMFARLKAQLENEIEKGFKSNKAQQLGGLGSSGSIETDLKENLTKMINSIVNNLVIDQLSGQGNGTPNQQRSLHQTYNKSQELDLGDNQHYLELVKTQRQLQEIKVINDKLHHEVQIINEKVNSLKGENQSLLMENERIRKANSPIRLNHHQDHNMMERLVRSSSPYQSQQQNFDMNTNEEIQSLRHKLRQIQQEKNDEFQKMIRNMNREMDSKSEEIERLTFELEKCKNSSAKEPHSRFGAPISPSMFNINTVSNDQVQFYKEFSDKQQERVQSLLKKTTKFLQSMKKLQKAVHKKEPNVTKEKADFEESRKDLESFIRAIQKENDVKSKDQNSKVTKQGGREQSIEGGHSYLQSAKYSLLLDYQSKAPNAFQRNDNPSITNLKSKQSTSQLQQQLSSLSQTQASKSFNPQNKYIISNSLLNTIGKQSDDHESLSKGVSYNNIRSNHAPNQERSPIPLRQTVSNFNRYQNQEMFRSLEAVDRRPQFASLEREREAYRSPSVNKDTKLSHKKTSLDKSNKKYQLSNMKNEISLLKQETQDLLNERNFMRLELDQAKKEAQTLISDNQLLAKQLERDRRKQEVNRREMNDLQLEKESLLHEFKRLSSNFNPINLSKNDYFDQEQDQEKDLIIAQINDDNQKLQDEIRILEQVTQEYKRTIGFLEESADVAKQTIIDLKEALASKDIELEENKAKTVLKDQKNQNNKISERELKTLKNHLMGLINEAKDQNDQVIRVMEERLSEKEEALGKLKRHIDRKVKEKEMQRENQSEKEVQAKIASLQAQVKELENRCEDDSELEKVKNKLDQKAKQLYDLQTQFNKEKQSLEKRIQELETQRANEKEELILNHQSELVDLQSQLQQERELVKIEYKKELDQQFKYQKDELLKEQRKRLDSLKKENEQLISEIKADHQEEINELLTQHAQDLEQQKKLSEQSIALIRKQQKSNEDSQKLILTQSNERVFELEQQLQEQDTLKDEQIQELQKQLSQQKESIKKNEKLLKEKDQRCKEAIDEMLLKQQEQEQTIQDLTQNISNIRTDKQQSDQTKLQELKQIKDRHAQEKQQLCDQIKILNKQIADLTNEKTELESQQENLRSQLGNEKGELVKKKEQEIGILKQNALKDKQTSQLQLEAKDKTISDLQLSLTQQASLKQEFIQMQTKLSQAQKQSQDELGIKQQELQQAHNRIQKEKAQYTQLLNQKDEQIKNISNEITQLNASFTLQTNNYKEQVAGLTSQTESLKKQLKQSSGILEAQDQELSQKDQQIEELEKSLKVKTDEVKKLSQDVQQQKALIQQLESKLQIKHQQLGSEAQQQIEQHQKELKQIQYQRDAFSQQVQSAQHELNTKAQTIKDLENESKYSKVIQQKLKKQLEDIQNEILQKENLNNEEKDSLSQQLQSLHSQLKQKDIEINQLKDQQQSMKQELKDKEQEHLKQLKQIDQHINELNSKVKQKETELESKQKEFNEMQQRKDSLIQQAKEERDHAHQQLTSMLSQNKNEKKTLEEKLQQQLSDAISSLQQKERESSEKDKLINELEKAYKEIELSKDLITQKNQILDEQNLQLQDELQEAQNSSDQKQFTLENNRNLIQMLKTEFQKSIDKQRELEQKLQGSTSVNEDTQWLRDDNTTLKEKLQQLRVEYDEKILTLQMKVDELDTESKLKTELIEEANKVIEDFNDENHEVKARFKHIMTILEEQEDESSYKEDDQIELEECFVRLEKELLKVMSKKDQRILQFEKDTTIIQDLLKNKEDELHQLQTKMGEVKCELMNALNKQDSNDLEMRRQMDNAGRKIENYKEKLIEKQKILNQLESERKNVKQDDSMVKENIELIQKLQKAESELQTYRLASMKKFSSNENSDEQNSKDNIERVQSLQEQLDQLRKQLFQAKDQVISNLSDTFAKKIRDLQQTYINENILKEKLYELNNKKGNPAIDLNTQIKECKRIRIGDKNLIVAYSLQTQSYYLLDQQQLSETSVNFLRSFVNQIESEDLAIDPKQEDIISKLVKQITELREDRQELKMELVQYKSKLAQGGTQPNVDEIQLLREEELEDDLGHTQAENQELKIKLKDLCLLNSQLKLRIIEINQMIQDYIPSGDNLNHENNQTIFEKVINLAEENKQLQNLLEDEKRKSSIIKQTKFYREEAKEQKNEDSFLDQMRRPDNIGGHHVGQGDDSNMFNQSSIEGVFEQLEGKGEADDALAPTKEVLQQKINKLEFELEGLNKKYRNLTAEVQKSQQTLNPTEASVIEHIKGTLIQFLKNTPLTEKNNEELLAIVFSMMEFTKEEVQDVQNFRQKMRLHSQSGSEPDAELSKQAKKGIFGIFKKKERDSSTKGVSSERTPQNLQSPSPIRPIKR